MSDGNLEINNSQNLHIVESSFLADSPPVEKMRQAHEEGSAMFWYELAQNARDYNSYDPNHPDDLPSIVCVMPNGERVSYLEYSSNPAAKRPVAVEVRNFIQADRTGGKEILRGLDPYSIADITHEGAGTYGQHGWGGSNAAAFALSDALCTGIKYLSVTKTGQVYEGEGKMMITNPEHQSKPRFVLEFHALPNGIDIKETVVTVIEPNDSLLSALEKLPRQFLPTNPRYEYCEFQVGQEIKVSPNLFTVTAEGQIKGENTAAFTPKEINDVWAKREIEPQDLRLRRVEILPTDVAGDHDHTVFVDGWQVYASYRKYALGWSFYGCDQKKDGTHYRYQAGRSEDSSHLVGSPINLMAKVLGKCSNPEVHLQIARYDVQKASDSYGASCVEAEIDYSEFKGAMTESSQVAIKEAYRRLVDELGLTIEEALVTSNKLLAERARAEGRAVIFLTSDAYIRAFVEFGGARTFEGTLNISKSAEYTLERMYIDPSQERISPFQVRSQILGLMSKHHGVLHETTGLHQIEIQLRGQPGFLPERFLDLDFQVIGLIRAAITLYGDQFTYTVAVDNGQSAVFFEFDVAPDRRSRSDKHGFMVEVNRGELAEAHGPRVSIILAPRSGAAQKIDELKNNLKDDITRHTNPKTGKLEYDDIAALQAALAQRTHNIVQARSVLSRRLGMGKYEAPKRELNKSSEFGHLGNMGDYAIGWAEELQGAVRLWLAPDAIYTAGYGLPVFTQYLLEAVGEGFNPDDYTDIVNIPRRSRPSLPSVRYKALDKGNAPVLIPPGYEPAAYTTRGSTQLTFFQNPENLLWAVNADIPVKGLTIYLERSYQPDTAEPRLEHLRQLVDIEDLSPAWSRLIDAVNSDTSLTGGQRFNIVFTALRRSFTYTTPLQYSDEKGNRDYAAIINEAKGYCQQITEALVALSRLVSVPAEVVSCYSASFGRVDISTTGHAMIRVYTGLAWEYYEPQSNVYNRDSFEKFPARFKALIRALPKGKIDLSEIVKQSIPLTPLIPIAYGTAELADSLLAPVVHQLPAVNLPGGVPSVDIQPLLEFAHEHPEVLAIIAGILGIRIAYGAGSSRGQQRTEELHEQELSRIYALLEGEVAENEPH